MSEAWSRPYFAAGGGDALVHYVVFGAVPDALRVSRSRHRYSGHEAIEVRAVQRDDQQFFDADVEGVWQRILGNSGVERGAVTGPNQQAIVRGIVPDPADLGYLRDAVGLVTALLETGAAAVLDLQALRFFDAREWNDAVFAPDAPIAREHVAVLASNGWLHTRGMRKFGRPDLSMENVEAAWRDAAIEVFERVIGFQIAGGIIDPAREIAVPGFPEGYFAELAGSLEDPDFNNAYWRLARR